MLDHSKTKLLILDNIEADPNLPKYKTAIKKAGNSIFGMVGNVDGQPSMAIGGPNNFTNLISPGFTFEEDQGYEPGKNAIEHQLNFTAAMKREKRHRFFKKYFGWLMHRNKADKPKLTVIDFFKSVKASLENVDIYQEKVNNFLSVAEHAKKCGQQALFEEIMKDVDIVKTEALLLSGDFKTCITEQQIVTFYKESEKGLQLHYVRNFTRIIPEEVLKCKERADKLEVFDNYCVLYYDKDAKTFKQTQEEIKKENERRKDPILFGLIKGSRKLYYIADWVDEYCDLQLNHLIDKFGHDAIKANNLTVNYKK